MSFDLKARRIELGLTLEQVGEMVGVGKSTVRKWETGYIENMGRDKIISLARALRINPMDIIDPDHEFVDSMTSKISGVVTKLNSSNKAQVYEFAKGRLKDQTSTKYFKMPEALAAHADDIDHEYTDKEIMHNHDFLKDAIKKYRGKNKE